MTQLLENAAYGAALILAAALLRRLLKERLVPEVRLALWAVCPVSYTHLTLPTIVGV